MSRGLGLWAMAVAVAVLAGCADRGKSATADARLAWNGPTDFSRVATYATRELSGSLQNVGRSHLNIVEMWMEDGDGAYVVDFADPGPHELIPGGDCPIKIKFNPRRVGSHPAYLVVRSDSHQEPIFRVPLSAEALDARAKVDESRLDFGRIELGSEKVRTLSLENPSDLPVKVTPRRVGQDADEFQVETVVLQPHEKRTLEVRFAPTRAGKKLAALAVAPCEGCVDHVVTVLAEGLDRAIVAEPTELDFGQVPMDREQTLTLKLRNLSTEPQDVTQLVFGQNSDPSFTHLTGTVPFTLNGGEEREFTFRYSPGHMGGAQGDLQFSTSSKRNPTLAVPMYGFGGAAELCVSPLQFKFDPKPLGAKVSVAVSVKNCGTSNAGPLTVTEVNPGPSTTGVGGEDQFSVSDVTLPRTLNAGEELTFRVYYEPTRVGDAATSVAIKVAGIKASLARVEISGSGQDHAPCDLSITPGALDFGTVEPGREGLLGLKVNNVGTDVCPVKNIELVDDAGGVFKMPGGKINGVIVYAGYYFSFMVQAVGPQQGGTFSGMLKIEQWDQQNPVIYVPLVVNTQTSCIVAVPGWLDFGLTRPDCPALDARTVTLKNQCTQAVQVNSIDIGAGTTDGEFTIANKAATPLTLQPGGETKVDVKYAGQVTGMNVSPLYVGVDGLARPLLVSLVGESSSKGDKTDRFVQQDGSKVDVLFVVDNTASMVEEHPKLVNAIPSFIAAAQQKNVDLHVAVTTTGLDAVSNACPGGAEGGERGRFFPVDNARPRILTLQTPNVAQVLQQNVQVGQCAYVEQGFEAMKLALTQPLVTNADDPQSVLPNDGNAGFLRDEAALAVVFVGDEDDHSGDGVDDYVQWFRSVKGMNQAQRSTIYAIAPDGTACSTAGGTGTRYAEAALRTGGEVLSVCASDYSPLLSTLAQKAFSPQDRFTLSSEPEAGSVRVYVNGAEQTSGWTYDANKNQVVFAAKPAAGATIEIKYRKTCSQ